MQNYVTQSEVFSRSVLVPTWVQDKREKALRAFQALGFPKRQDKEWRYTSVTKLANEDFSLASSESTLAAHQISRVSEKSTRIVLVNGIFSQSLSDDLSSLSGVDVLTLRDALEKNGDELKSLLDFSDAGFFTNLNQAFLGHGVFIKVKDDVVVKNPLQITFVTTTPEHKKILVNPCLVMSVGKNSQASLVESYEFVAAESYFVNPVTRISLSSGASLKHYRLQCDEEKSTHIATTRVTQERDSSYQSFILSLGAKLHRHNVHVDLLESGSHASLSGLYTVKDQQHVDHHTCLDHHVSHTTSRQVYKGILDDQSRAVFQGKVVIARDARDVDAAQLNKNLLLSRQAEVDTKPQLEIHSGDVKCSHGATIGQINPDELFYFLSRGISEEEARKILVQGFAADVLSKIDDDEIKKYFIKVWRAQ